MRDSGPAGSGGRASALLVFLTTPVLGAMAYLVSVGSLSLIMLLGIFFLSRVPDTRPERTVDEFTPVVQ